jgi:putative membrane protein
LKPNLRRTIITLAAAGSIIVGAPALGYAQANAPQRTTEYTRFGAPGAAGSYAGLSFAGPQSPFGLRQDNNDNDPQPSSNNDNSFDDEEDTADNGNTNGNDNGAGSDEAAFLRAAVSDSATEIAAGRLALERGTTDEIRRFGERMARENEILRWQAASIAASRGVETQWWLTRDKEQRRLDALASRWGEDFDDEYLRSLVLDQRDDVAAYTSAKATMTDDVAEYANQNLWTFEEQLRAAEDIADRSDVDLD